MQSVMQMFVARSGSRNPCIVRCLHRHARSKNTYIAVNDRHLWQGCTSFPFGSFGSTSMGEIQGFLRSRWSVEMTGFGSRSDLADLAEFLTARFARSENLTVRQHNRPF